MLLAEMAGAPNVSRPDRASNPAPGARVLFNRRMAREWKTIELMVQCYCRAHHSPTGCLCPECEGLLNYAALRLERCRFGAEKPTCAKCPVHCYQRERRDQVKKVMRYAGSRMLWEHPILSLRHWADAILRRPASAHRVRE